MVEGKKRPSTGEPTWRAEIYMPLGQPGRNMAVRGPSRIVESQAHEDAKLLDRAAAEEGTFQAVKKVANDLIAVGGTLTC